jgi:homogentisate 1,2-dioxygenase
MMFPLQKGKHAKQAHVGLPEGTFEEEHGREAFNGPATHLYRTHPPTGWTRIEGPLKPRAYRLFELDCEDKKNPHALPTPCLFNDELLYSISRRKEAMPYYFRNADGDELYFIHEGKGILESDFGILPFETGDYIVIPKGTTYRIVPESKDNFFLIVETAGMISPPEKGLLGQHALYDPAVLRTPEPKPSHDKQEWELRIKREGKLTSVFYPFNPALDVVGWKGDLTVWSLNVRDIRPVVGPRGHLPPSVHTTFVSNKGMNIQTFVPRPLEEDPDCLKVPFYHRNIDFDEVIFYHAGQFFSRSGIDKGMITLHPYGIHHGPQPKAIEASKTKTRTEEIAILMEAEKPLKISPELEKVEWKDYYLSWMEEPAGTR